MGDVNEKFEELRKKGQIEFITFHQSYSYEDFVEGYRPERDKNGQLSYDVKDGRFKEICARALESVMPNKKDRLKIVKGKHKNKEFIGMYNPITKKVIIDGIGYAPSTAASVVIKKEFGYERSINGRDWWKINLGDGEEKSINEFDFESKDPEETIFAEYLKMPKKERMKLFEDLDESKKFVLIIDEINRANISKVFGELITLIEKNKRLGAEEELPAQLPCSGETFGVPKNLYIIGTMNSTDKSIALVDMALRRRFKFERMDPKYHLNTCKRQNLNQDLELPEFKSEMASDILFELNKRIVALKDEDHQIGHSYLMKQEDIGIKDAIRDEILPLLEEYFYNDWKALAAILGADSIETISINQWEAAEDDGKFNKTNEKSHGYRLNREKATNNILGFANGQATEK